MVNIMSLRTRLVTLSLIAGLGFVYALAAEAPIADQRMSAAKLKNDGNWKEAYAIYSKLVMDKSNHGKDLASDYQNAVDCLRRLQRHSELDAFRKQAVDLHAQDFWLLSKAADLLISETKYGFIVAGEFQRGNRRGGGQPANATERDRVEALQLMDRARKRIPQTDLTDNDRANFFHSFATQIMFNRQGGLEWRLQDLTDLETLPDYDIGYGYGFRGAYGHGQNKGAPVDEQGQPIFYQIPKSWETAQNDGERWRWCLEQMAQSSAARRRQADYMFASFLHREFGVQTMREWGIILPMAQKNDQGPGRGDDVDEASPFSLHTLTDEETIARLASGVKRFKLPGEFNFLKIFRKLADGEDDYARSALMSLAQIHTNRQQYVQAAKEWKEHIQRFGSDKNKRQQLNQIIGNWGTFEPVMTQPSGSGATVEFRFRNARHVSFTARRIKIPLLLDDVKTYLKSHPKQVDWNRIQIGNIGYQIVQQNKKRYLGEEVARWDLELKPPAEHFDRRITVTTPLQKAGAYFLTAKLDDGNISRIIIWISDTAIVKKNLNGKVLYFVADAVSGKPIPKANVEFFGWRQERIPKTKRDYRLVTEHFAEFTDAEGMILAGPKMQNNNLQWLITARTDAGRLAYLGFTGVWFGRYHDQQYHQTKVITITDRPVYRPEQKVHFKFWIREAKYDKDNGSRFANKKFTIKINDPTGTTVHEKQYTTDEFGGLAGEYDLPEDAKLGQYYIYIDHQKGVHGGNHFRVEEYKKPEFEVTVDAPDKPVTLGEKVTATIQARYYFGAPVTEAKVKFKVERTPHDARWYPPMPWDWLYGEGYWWFASDYKWYPGFQRWGCLAPRPIWFHWSPNPPELVLDQEVEIGPDGKVKVEIDTALAKALHGDEDHQYKITAEVVDASRRTIVGTGSIIVSREPFRVFAWTTRGHYRVGDTIQARFQARTLDGRAVTGKGKLQLLRITYDEKGIPQEHLVSEWDLDTDATGAAAQSLVASEAGQYRLSYKLTDSEGHTVEGGYLFVIRGADFDGSEFRFNDLELITDKTSYAPGEKIELMINTNHVGSTVLLFLRPSNGIYLARPKILHLAGKSTVVDVGVVKKDMPNFYIEAMTIAHGKVHTALREVIVPPEKRILNVEIIPNSEEYQPGEKAEIQVKVTDFQGEPYAGSLVMTVYDRAVEYISGGSNVPGIREHFWKWRRSHHPNSEHNLSRMFWNLIRSGELSMQNLGVFGDLSADVTSEAEEKDKGQLLRKNRRGAGFGGGLMENSARMAAPGAPAAKAADFALDSVQNEAQQGGTEQPVEPQVRSEFADTAYWNGKLSTNEQGLAVVSFEMPENLTSWKIRTWGMGHGTRVGEGTMEVVTTKNIIVRLQSPRFFVERDEVVLSAVVHNYLDKEKQVTVGLRCEGGTLELLDKPDNIPAAAKDWKTAMVVTVPANGETRVDWRCRAIAEGDASITMSALTDEESDAMRQTFPVYVHGFLKTESFSGVVRGEESSGTIEFNVPEDRRPEQTRLEVRYSPTLAGAMVDALPYLVDYPYGCTEQTLNRFLPTVITQKILLDMGLDLKAIRDKRTNLNAQEIGNDAERAKQWKRYKRNPVFDEQRVARMVKQGVKDLTAMQLSDGGWGWFSGYGEHSAPHTTAVVVHGLQLAQQNDVAIVPGVIEKGINWLKTYQNKQVQLLRLWEKTKGKKGKSQCSNVDALVFMVLCDSDVGNPEMERFLYRDRLKLSPYSQALLGLAFHAIQSIDKRDMVIRNLDQFLTVDNENQTAYLDLPNRWSWWYWYGDQIEANASYLKLLTKVNPQNPKAAGLVKYLLNNRKHATYWKSTRDTAYCIEALAEYLVASGEAKPHVQVEVWLDGKLQKTVEITPDVLFSFDNSFVIQGAELASGPHKLELRKKPLDQKAGTRTPVYYNAYLTNFSLEDFITKAGLEIKVNRTFYKLVQREGATDAVQGSRGQVIDQKTLKYDRVELHNMDQVQSGDLIEIELEIDSKNDYEYVIFEDLKAAGCEPVDLRSGYTSGGLGAYVEFRDEKVAFFMRTLARGKHSVSYRVRAEIPGKFSALPTRAYAMYAPELKANSDEMKIGIRDAE